MSKNILILSSTPRRGGNSDTLCGGVWHVGEIKGNPLLREAYEMGKQA